jgi:Rps23 Pro-64 3,4-dihydroxylase Tpa1-like proline 4-hydroxylase
MKLSLSSEINTARLTQEFSLNKKVQISQILPVEQTAAIYQFLHRDVTFDQAFTLNNKAALLSKDSLNRMTRSEFDSLLRDVYDNASKGIGYWYGRAAESDMSSSVLGDFNLWLKSKKVVDFIKQVTGQLDICDCVIQYTRYVAGDFLTRHKDIGAEGTRKIAFVFHFSPNWHPDWGGLLQFYHPSGQPKDAWAPEFGSLHLFDTQHIHAVTTISPFAPAARYTISGWFINQ